MFSIDININPSNLSWSIEEHNLVLTDFSVENECSAEQEVIGIVNVIEYTRTRVGYMSTLSGVVVWWLSLLHNLSNKAWSQVLHRSKSCWQHARDSLWWGSLRIILAIHLLVNHTTKKIKKNQIKKNLESVRTDKQPTKIWWFTADQLHIHHPYLQCCPKIHHWHHHNQHDHFYFQQYQSCKVWMLLQNCKFNRTVMQINFVFYKTFLHSLEHVQLLDRFQKMWRMLLVKKSKHL